MADFHSTLAGPLASTATLKLTKLHSLDAFYTPIDERFERLGRLTRRSLTVPVAGITVVQDGRQWFKSIIGWNATELPLGDSLCAAVVENGEPLIVPDTSKHPRLAQSLWVRGAPGFGFYAGFPLKDSDGETVGTLCGMAYQPREPGPGFLEALSDLGTLAERELFTMELSSAQAQLTRKLDAARRQAMFDPLTRIWNRRGADALLNTALKDSAARSRPLTICLADVDNFKSINDRYGHAVGDQVLRRVASTISAAVRSQDVVCRYGGDEFLVIFHESGIDSAPELAQRLCDALLAIPAPTGEAALPLAVSVGAAVRTPTDPISSAALIEKADEALFTSKRSGRNRVTVHGETTARSTT